MKNIVYIATSLDGYIADRDGGLEWLESVPNPDGDDFGFAAFMESVDALLMGRKTFEVVCGFDVEWPYTKPVFVLSSTLRKVPEKCAGKAFVVRGPMEEALHHIHAKGYSTLYVDGGKTVQSCLEYDLIDELILFRIPVLLGGGTPLFGTLPGHMPFAHKETEVLSGEMVKSHYVRNR